MPSQPDAACEQPDDLRPHLGFAQVEISRIELGSLFQPRPVQDREMTVLKLDQPLTPQLLKTAVDVNRREPAGVAQFRLREGGDCTSDPESARPLAGA